MSPSAPTPPPPQSSAQSWRFRVGGYSDSEFMPLWGSLSAPLAFLSHLLCTDSECSPLPLVSTQKHSCKVTRVCCWLYRGLGQLGRGCVKNNLKLNLRLLHCETFLWAILTMQIWLLGQLWAFCHELLTLVSSYLPPLLIFAEDRGEF